ncbi:lasso peptide biosynthesis B2 protein [Sphingomonas sp. UYEF23]|uniref:lasso peptide biosynthesis B2 protein n=1 Tax=Sphingomonas sp. UYEF23 TaxID=1756408 RepID=UPI0033981483
MLFLDTRADRYFCLRPEAEAAFRRLTADAAEDPGDRTILESLARNSILETADATPTACRAIDVPTDALIDRLLPQPNIGGVASAMVDLTRVKIALRLRGLAAVLRTIERAKACCRSTLQMEHASRSALAAFQRTTMLWAPHDQCLPRSIAIARRMLALGFSVDLVIGVKLRPFGAHCWVQQGPLVVNDRPDMVRDFTPILVI